MITSNERKALQKIVDSEYQDGGDPVGHDVWTQYVNPFKNKRTLSGVYASLVKKGFIAIGGDFDMILNGKAETMGTVSITQAGYDALRAPAIERAVKRADAVRRVLHANPNPMKTASYREGVEWIALNDAPGDEGSAKDIAGYISVCLLADLFGVDTMKVARAVVRYRRSRS